MHFVTPLAESVALFDTRDQVFTTGAVGRAAARIAKTGRRSEPLKVQAKEGLTLGLAITVRYRLDPRRLDLHSSNLPQPVEKEIVPPVVASVFRRAGSQLHCSRRIRDASARKCAGGGRASSSRSSAGDGILVKEVMLRDIQLPPEYAKGLEGLLLKEQENDRMAVETDIKQKRCASPSSKRKRRRHGR